MLVCIKKPYADKYSYQHTVFTWCGRWDLNPYDLSHAPQACASADSATAAGCVPTFSYVNTKKTESKVLNSI